MKIDISSPTLTGTTVCALAPKRPDLDDMVDFFLGICRSSNNPKKLYLVCRIVPDT